MFGILSADSVSRFVREQNVCTTWIRLATNFGPAERHREEFQSLVKKMDARQSDWAFRGFAEVEHTAQPRLPPL